MLKDDNKRADYRFKMHYTTTASGGRVNHKQWGNIRKFDENLYTGTRVNEYLRNKKKHQSKRHIYLLLVLYRTLTNCNLN